MKTIILIALLAILNSCNSNRGETEALKSYRNESDARIKTMKQTQDSLITVLKNQESQ